MDNEKNRPWFMGILRCFAKILTRKPKFIYLGEKIKPGSMILSNHAGKKGPLTLECYFKDVPFRFWGTHEMNDGLRSVYRYLTVTYYHNKKHWPLWLARIVCLIVAPLTNLFYRGLNLLPTYPDNRLLGTYKESIKTLQNNQSVVIFPEDSSRGYFDHLTSFHPGFFSFAKVCYSKGMDLPIYIIYYRRKTKEYIVDKPIMFSQIKDLAREDVAKQFCDRANELGETDLSKLIEQK